MSGPKIVIVKSEAQLQRERERSLSDLARSSARWRELLEKSGELSADKIAVMESRVKALAEQFKLNHELALNEIAKEIQFLQSDIENARGKAIEKRAHQLAVEIRHKRLGKNAAAQANAEAADLKELLGAPQRREGKAPGVSEEGSTYKVDNELLGDLSQELSPTPMVSNNSETLDADSTQPDKRLTLLLAQIQLFEAHESEKFSRRLEAIEAEVEADLSRRRLLTDSLVLDMARFCKEQKQIEEVRQILLAARAALEGVAAETCAAILEKTDKILKAAGLVNLAEAQKVKAEAEETRRSFFAQKDARDKRKAILESFAAIGYEVTESMSTAWAKDGRIILAKAGCPDEGVEIAAAEGVERLQVRAVAMVAKGKQHNVSRDVEIETKWCSSFDKLRQDLAQKGQHTTIATALPIGSAPLKVCESQVWMKDELGADSDEEEARADAPRRQSRSIGE